MMHRRGTVNVSAMADMQLLQNWVGAAPNKVTDQGISPAMVAAFEGQLPALELLLDAGADLALVARDGRGALHVAAAEGQIEVIKWLLSDAVPLEEKPAARAKQKDHAGKAPMEIAMEAGRREAASYLYRFLNPPKSEQQLRRILNKELAGKVTAREWKAVVMISWPPSPVY
jgi:ankyrin repeat protein